jgi:2-polyprenyl-6-methoxyphenol hydroxylase-like FAD-dependent oxidoreductase
MPHSTSPRILIVGGGIGGLTLGAQLARRGLHAHIIEKTPQWAPAGAGIVLGINAMRVMADLGVADALLERGMLATDMDITDHRAHVLSSVNMTALSKELGPSICIHRAELHDVLVAANANNTLRLDTTLTKLEHDADECRVVFSDGTADTYDLVVGADGLRSQVRDMTFGPTRYHYSGYTCWRFVVDGLSHITHTQEMWGRGRRVGVVPIGNGKVYSFTTLNVPQGDPAMKNISVEDYKSIFAHFEGVVPEMLSRITDSDQLIHNDLEEVRLPSWTRGRVGLLGDAAHAMTPNMGQGAAMAIEDAYVLAELLEAGGAVSDILTAYEARRRPRVTWVQQQSWRIGKVAQWESAAGCAMRNLAMKCTPDKMGETGLRKLLVQSV